jgi:hypothetical protein
MLNYSLHENLLTERTDLKEPESTVFNKVLKVL